MKRIILILLFLCFSTSLFAANVYFIVVNPGDVENGSVYYSDQNIGRASMSYTIAHVSQYFLSVQDYGAKIKYPDGNWGSWQNTRQGGWGLTKAGTYKIQGRVYVNMDRSGQNNYWMFSNILTFTVVDNYAPATPQNFQASFPYNQSPVLSWSTNTEDDLDGYRVYKKYTTSSGTQTTSVFTTSNSYTDPEFTANYKFGNDEVEYWVVAEDINGNVSGETQHISGDGTSNYQWKRANDETVSNTIEKYELFTNYPNPFNPTTQISYQVPKNSFVNLIVYNSLGQQVSLLVNQTQETGKYSVRFNASNLPSGVYIYKLQAGEFSSTKKMILTK